MVRRIRIRTRRNRREVINTIRESIREVVPPYAAVEVLKENLVDFHAKSDGGTDRDGNGWRKLSDKRIKWKQNKILKKRRTVARNTKAYQKIVNRFRSQASGTGLSPAEANRRAIAAANALLGIGHIQVNIDTRALVESISPGEIIGNRYIPPGNQGYSHSKRHLRITSEVEDDGTKYARYVHNMRPIVMPARWQARWARAGIENSIVPLAKHIKGAL